MVEKLSSPLTLRWPANNEKNKNPSSSYRKNNSTANNLIIHPRHKLLKCVHSALSCSLCRQLYFPLSFSFSLFQMYTGPAYSIWLDHKTPLSFVTAFRFEVMLRHMYPMCSTSSCKMEIRAFKEVIKGMIILIRSKELSLA